jgi:hypothetical protein
MQKVEPFKKIALGFRAGSEADAMNPEPPGSDFTFVYGIGTDGLTPFEYLLAGKRERDDISFRVTRSEAAHFFGHILPAAAAFFANQDDVFFRVKIARIQTAEPREVIRAMADMTSHGHGSGCDCGCGCG